MIRFSPLLAISLLALFTAAASAQTGSSNGSMGSSLAYTSSSSTPASRGVPTYANPNVPGATGDTIVRGDDSTIAGDRAATLEQKEDQY
jgi:hypothetical protein